MTTDEIRVQERLKKAWAALPAEQKESYRPLIEAAHAQLSEPAALGLAESNDTAPHEMAMVKSFLDDNMEGPAKEMMLQQIRGIEIRVDEGGHIWGTGKYQVLDIGWVEAFAVYLEYLHYR